MRKTFWERRCEKDVVRKTLWERCGKINLKTLGERRCQKYIADWDVARDVAWITLWERQYEKDIVRKTLWERRYEENVVRKTLCERRRFIFDGASPSINLLIYKLRKCRIRSSTKPSFFSYSIFCVCKLVRYFQRRFQ